MENINILSLSLEFNHSCDIQNIVTYIVFNYNYYTHFKLCYCLSISQTHITYKLLLTSLYSQSEGEYLLNTFISCSLTHIISTRSECVVSRDMKIETPPVWCCGWNYQITPVWRCGGDNLQFFMDE